MELGPVGRTVAENVRRVREGRALTFAEVARRIEEIGRPISALGIRRIEEGARRVDVDDLYALAVALGVGPGSLLLPYDEDERRLVGVTPVIEAPLDRVNSWLTKNSPLPRVSPHMPPEEDWLRYMYFAAPPRIYKATLRAAQDQAAREGRQVPTEDGRGND